MSLLKRLKSSRLAILILLFVISIPTFIKMARPGYFPMHDDMQAMRVLQLDRCVNDGQLPCRWVPDMGYGYGYPQFIFYSPLPYYSMEAFHLLGFSLLDSVKIVMSLGFLLAGMTMYLLGSSLWGRAGGLLSAILYLYAPYRASDLYSRGAVAEFTAMVFLPLIFYAIREFIKTKQTKNLIILSLSYSGLLLSHNLTTLAFTPLAAIWGLFYLYHYRRFRLLPHLIFSALLGVGLSAFFVLPAFFEKPFVHLETMTVGYFNYLAHFVSLGQLFFSSFWGFGSSELGPYDDLGFAIGTLHWFLLGIALIFALLRFRRQRQYALPVLLLGLFFISSVFMTHQRSVFIWNNLPFLKYFQFPWRFLVIATFASSAAGGSLLAFTSHLPTRKWLLITLSFLVILLNFNFFKPQSWINITDQEKFSGPSWDKQMTISIFDYLPIFANMPPSQPAPNQPELLEGAATVTDYQKGSHWQSGNLEVISDQATIRLPLFYYPGFTLTLDNKTHPLTYDNPLGLITFTTPQGNHSFHVKLESTPIRRFSDILTLASLASLIIFSIRVYNQKKN